MEAKPALLPLPEDLLRRLVREIVEKLPKISNRTDMPVRQRASLGRKPAFETVDFVKTETGFAVADKGALNGPIITVVGETQTSVLVHVCGGASGAPAGFSLQWDERAEFEGCAGSFSGNANQSRFNLDPCECVVVEIGNLIDEPGASFNCNELCCGQNFFIRGFAHATRSLKRSAFTDPILAGTEACEEVIRIEQPTD